MRILLLIFMLIPFSAQAAKCPGENVRLDGPGGSMEEVKARDQRTTNTCYAFAAAQVWDAYRFSHYDKATLEKEKKYFTIPMQGALAVHLNEGNIAKKADWKAEGTLPIEKNGGPIKTLHYFMSNPTCVSTFTSDELFTDLPGKTREEKMAYLQTILEDGETVRKLQLSYQNKSKGKDKKAFDELNAEYVKKVDAIVANREEDPLTACFKKGTLDKFVDQCIRQAQFSENSLSNILKALLASCEKKSAPVNVVAPKIQSGAGTGVGIKNNVMTETPTQASKTIHLALSGKFNEPTQPVIVDVCGNFLNNGKESDGMRRKADGTIDVNAMPAQVYYGRCKPHSMVAIGRKTVGDTCQILIRNSFQKNCNEVGYSKDWKCDEKEGNVWIDESTLMKNLLNYSFFKER